jgi:ABC-2 type transport system permease protein
MSAIAPPTRRTALAAPSPARLVAVELRKMTNTRSGFWLPVGVALLTLAVAIIASANHHGHAATFTHVLHATVQPAGFLLPLIGVLLICSEWSQRTTLTTFTLVPSRPRVIGAKLGASVCVATIAWAVCLALTVVCAAALGHHPGGAGTLTWQVIAQSWLFLASGMVMGLAFGAAVLVSAPAIVAYLLLPTVWGAVASNINALSGVATWLDPGSSLTPFTQHAMSATEWAHALATFGVWIGIPIVIGALRIGRGDID